jgi:hypothetical protein
MFRRDAYRKVGGYREAFYYGQDWDLWYRLAAVGTFQLLPDVLYVASVERGSISTSRRRCQQRAAKLALAAARATWRGESDAPILERAARMSRRRRRSGPWDRAAESYHLGAQLLENGDARARGYLRDAVRQWPIHWKAWLRLLQSRR